jgi:hypothetical protein
VSAHWQKAHMMLLLQSFDQYCSIKLS